VNMVTLEASTGLRLIFFLGACVKLLVPLRLAGLDPLPALVTPDMHRVHHSVLPRETGSNFGFNLPWWDRLLALPFRKRTW